ncbi:MAG TPA: hypothetical protein VF426_08195, partial [Marmoricola sp.]
MRRTTGVWLVVACALAVLLSGCGSSHKDSGGSGSGGAASSTSSAAPGITDDNLATFVKSLQQYVPQIKKQYASTYAEITVTGTGAHTLIYTYTYKKVANRASAKTGLEKTVKKLQSVCDEKVFPGMTQA